MIVLRSLLFYAVFYTGSVFYVLGVGAGGRGLAAARAARSPTPGRASTAGACACCSASRCARPAAGPPGPALYAIKHESFFEAIDLPDALDHPVPFGKEELFRIPGWGRAAKAYGAVTVARDAGRQGAARDARRSAQRSSARGRPLAIFPEGTRVPHGTRPPLQAGFAGLYKLLGLPVVPVAVDSGPLYHRWWKRPGTITLHFGEPIEPGLPREEIEARVHAAINVLNS